ncbi:hypothetical protein QLQ12_40720 [Actinoplanes sp. NEAU-A12]|uniref:Uncharacterized protein n=1 Tax=Actinoplanes sandaracinus TaxID=3045177 RepID=A0ABT6WZ27_9ACTN|nr:hypothetical protein [Actinoplanes sandaracinus]MDI6104929.1 hypothetical protein [Actinoplanes sandaracinus]
MTMQSWDDDAMLREMASALREAGHLTGRVRAAGDAAWTWRGIDEELELAALTYDSLLRAGPELRSESAGGRTVRFTGPSAEVHLEREADAVVGQLVPPRPGRLTVEGARGHHAEAEIDEVGCLSFTPPDGEPVRLRVRAGTVDLVTDWIRI